MHASPTKQEQGPDGNTSAFQLLNPAGTPTSSLPVVPGFELLEEIGRGGMGVIYRARDTELDRDIAIKFLQAKYDVTSISGLRFVEEARITGQLQHPGIPAVHRVGHLPDGRPYLVMKLIKGYALNELIWKKREAPSATSHTIPPNFLGVFEAICQAVGYAHAHHVIHRDLKPHNIMVGAFGEVQVMDWGLAKVIQQEAAQQHDEQLQHDPHATISLAHTEISSSSSQLTVAGSILGTPGYMAPEQAVGANDLLDARADVFGLGAILATLLTGKPPFEGDSPETVRLQSAMGILQPCYERLNASGADPDLVKLAQRCLAMQRSDRPRNGGEVAHEVAQLRIAADERAQQAALQRAKAEVQVEEQLRRRRIGLIASAIVVSVLLTGIIATTWGLLHAASKEQDAREAANLERQAKLAEAAQRERAVLKEAETQSILDFMLNRVIAAARPKDLDGGKGREIKLRDALVSSLISISDEFNQQPVIEARLRLALGQSFWYLGDYPLAEGQLNRSRELTEKHLGPRDKQTIKTVLAIANVQEALGHHEQALTLRENAFVTSKEAYGVEEHLTQIAMNNLSASYERLGRKADVLRLREDVVKLTQSHLGTTHPFTLISMTNLSLTYFQQGRYDEAIKLLKEAVKLQENHLGNDHAHTLASKHNLADCLNQLGKYQDALPLHQDVLKKRQDKLGIDHADTLNSMMGLSFCYSAQGQYDHALTVLQKTLPLYEKRLGKDHPQTLFCLRANINSLFDLHRSAEALPLIESCLQRTRQLAMHQELESVMYLLRFRHYREQQSVTDCKVTLAQWEKLIPLDAENTFELGYAWALLSTLRQQIDKQDGIAEADKAMMYIQQASDRGWHVLKPLEEEKALKGLRSRDDCRLLIAKLKKDDSTSRKR